MDEIDIERNSPDPETQTQILENETSSARLQRVERLLVQELYNKNFSFRALQYELQASFLEIFFIIQSKGSWQNWRSWKRYQSFEKCVSASTGSQPVKHTWSLKGKKEDFARQATSTE